MQMRQLIQNLVSNGLKFHRPSEAPLVTISAELLGGNGNGVRPKAQMCRILVTDNGIGFEEKYLDRIFNVFQRLHSRGQYEGTGIGLAICRKIAERHGGSITANSERDKGAAFAVMLPVKQSTGAAL
jgi:signal transduction histidine kinase